MHRKREVAEVWKRWRRKASLSSCPWKTDKLRMLFVEGQPSYKIIYALICFRLDDVTSHR